MKAAKSKSGYRPMSHYLRGGVIFCIAAAISGCAGSNLPTASVSSVNQEVTERYSLAAGDDLKITVFDEPNLTGEYKVGVGGDLSLPLIDPIKAQGKSPQDVAGEITELLKLGQYVLYPRVSVEILNHRPYYILGEVKNPGEYPYSGNLSFEQAVAKAGGFTPRANRGSIVLRRQDWQTGKKIVLDDEALKIAPGDTITVQEAFF